jgi:hypothetical protein
LQVVHIADACCEPSTHDQEVTCTVSARRGLQARLDRRALQGTIGPIALREASVVVPGGTAHNSQCDTETVSVNCNANEKAISAGTGWSDDAADRELWTQRLTPVRTGANVTGFRATGGNDSGNGSIFTLYVLCYVG